MILKQKKSAHPCSTGAYVIASLLNEMYSHGLEIEDITRGHIFDYLTEAYVEEGKAYKTIPEQTYKKIVLGIDRTLTHQRLYLNPNLRLKDIAESCDYCQTYVSKVFKEQYGGFFQLFKGRNESHSI